MTEDFRVVMEKVSSDDLSGFFEQWIFTKGFPELKWKWEYKRGKVSINIAQTQQHHTFKFPLEIGIINGKEIRIETFMIDEKSETFEIPMDAKPEDLVLDPELWLLFEEKK
jgi:aminopeptidase N